MLNHRGSFSLLMGLLFVSLNTAGLGILRLMRVSRELNSEQLRIDRCTETASQRWLKRFNHVEVLNRQLITLKCLRSASSREKMQEIVMEQDQHLSDWTAQRLNWEQRAGCNDNTETLAQPLGAHPWVRSSSDSTGPGALELRVDSDQIHFVLTAHTKGGHRHSATSIYLDSKTKTALQRTWKSDFVSPPSQQSRASFH